MSPRGRPGEYSQQEAGAGASLAEARTQDQRLEAEIGAWEKVTFLKQVDTERVRKRPEQECQAVGRWPRLTEDLQESPNQEGTVASLAGDPPAARRSALSQGLPRVTLFVETPTGGLWLEGGSESPSHNVHAHHLCQLSWRVSHGQLPFFTGSQRCGLREVK